jgi:hypothetical protein
MKFNDLSIKLGKEIDSLIDKMDKEPDRRLRQGYQKRIQDIKSFMENRLTQAQDTEAARIKEKSIAEAKTLDDIVNIAADHNDDAGVILQQKMGGTVMPQYKCGGRLTRHGVLGNIANSVGQVISDPIGTTQSMVQNAASNPASTAVGGAIGGGAGTAIGAGIGTLLGGPIGTIAGSLAGGHIGTNLGLQQGGQGWDALNPFASTSGGAPTPADQGPGQQQLPPPPPPGMGGGMPGYKMVHDAYYKNGGRMSRYATEGEVEGGNNWWDKVPWDKVAGATGNMMTQGSSMMPMMQNQMLLNQPNAWMWNPIGPADYLYSDLNLMRDKAGEISALADIPEYYSPAGALLDLDKTYGDLDKATEDLTGQEKYLAQMNLLGDKADRRGATIRHYGELTNQANSPTARMQKKLMALNPFQQLFANAFNLNNTERQAQLGAWDWNNRVDAMRDAIGSQLAQDTSEYAQGNRNDIMMGNALDMGMFYNYNPMSGIGWGGV